MAKEGQKKKEKDSYPFRAKKDFLMWHNDYFREIRKGDDLSDVPEKYIEQLKLENVL